MSAPTGRRRRRSRKKSAILLGCTCILLSNAQNGFAHGLSLKLWSTRALRGATSGLLDSSGGGGYDEDREDDDEPSGRGLGSRRSGTRDTAAVTAAEVSCFVHARHMVQDPWIKHFAHIC